MSQSSLLYRRGKLFHCAPVRTLARQSVFPLRQLKVLRPAGNPQGPCFCYLLSQLWSVPVTVRVTLPGVVVQLPSSFWVKLAAGTAICPGRVVNSPVAWT